MVDAFAPHDIQVPEQVIEVPKILIDELPLRTPVREPQLAEQLVEAPSIVSLIEVTRQPVEQIVDIPVPRGGVRLRGVLPEQGSTALPVEQIVDIPVLHGESLQGFIPEQGSTALPVEQIVDIPVLHGESLQGFIPGHGSTASSSSSHVPAGAVDESFQGIFSYFSSWEKSAKMGPYSGSELGADFSSSTPASHESGFFTDAAGGVWIQFPDGRWKLLCSDP